MAWQPKRACPPLACVEDAQANPELQLYVMQ